VEKRATGLVDRLPDLVETARGEDFLVELDQGEVITGRQTILRLVIEEADDLQVGDLGKLFQEVAGVGANSLPGDETGVKTDFQTASGRFFAALRMTVPRKSFLRSG